MKRERVCLATRDSMTALLTFAALRASLSGPDGAPVMSERTLRGIISALGYSRGKGRLFFTPEQVVHIRDALACRVSTAQGPVRETARGSSEGQLEGVSTRSQRARRTRELRMMSGSGSGQPSKRMLPPNVVPISR